MELRTLLLTLFIFFIVGNVNSRRTSIGRSSSSRISSRSRPISRSPPRPPIHRAISRPAPHPVQNAHPGKKPTTHQGNQHATNDFLHTERGGHSTNGGPPALPPVRTGSVINWKQQSPVHKPTAPVAEHYAKASAPPPQNNGFRHPPYGTPPHNNQKFNMSGTSYVPTSHSVSPPYPTNVHPVGIPHPNNGQATQTHIGLNNQQPPIGHVNQPMLGNPYGQQLAGNPYGYHPIGNGNQPSYNPHYPTQPLGTPYQTIGAPYGHPVGNSYANPSTGIPYSPPAHSYPAPSYGVQPAQTILVVPGQQSSNNGRGVGQLVKEALIFSSVNAAVNRVINPSHYHSHYQDNDLSRPISGTSNAATTSTTSNTQITYNNQYFNQPSPDSNGSGVVASGTVNMNVPDGTGVYPNGAAPSNPTVNQGNGNPIGSRNAFENIPGSRGVGTADQNIANNNTSVSLANGNGMTGLNVPADNTTVSLPNVTGMAGPNFVNDNPTLILTNGTEVAGRNVTNDNTGHSQTNSTANSSVPNQGNPETNPDFVSGIQYTVTDEELWKITEDLFAKDRNNANKYITLNLQNRTEGYDGTDKAVEPLLFVKPEAYQIPTVQVIRSLYDNYEFEGQVKENITDYQRMEENLLLDIFLETEVMATAMRSLANRSLIEDDPYTYKDTLKHIWFTRYYGFTSGFERVFMGELYGNTTVVGVQDWIYFESEESAKRADYMGCHQKVDLGNNGTALVKMDFTWNGAVKREATLIIGTSPELEMALYTICFFARPSDVCPVSLGGTKFNIYTHSFRYFGHDVIDAALLLI